MVWRHEERCLLRVVSGSSLELRRQIRLRGRDLES